MQWEDGPAITADVRAVQGHLNYLLYDVDVEGDSFTGMITCLARPGLPIIYRPSTEFVLALSHCGQIIQDVAGEIARHYLIPVADPYQFDPGNLVIKNLEAGVASVEGVQQLAVLGLRRLRSGA